MKKSENIAVLVSGGMDSCILLAELHREKNRVVPIYIRNGLYWEDAELYWLKRFIKAISSGKTKIEKLTVFKMPMADLYQGHWSLTGKNVPDERSPDPSVYLPGRNLLLLAKALVFCGMNRIGTIALGPLQGNPFPDSSPDFFRTLSKTASIGLDFSITIWAPFLSLSKDKVLKRGRRFPLELTFSCIQPAKKYHCGVCNKCAERQRAFKKAGIEDRTVYKKGAGYPRSF